MKQKRSPISLNGLFIPILLWIAMTPWSNWLDLKISHTFYQDHSFYCHPLCDWIYHYGFWPAWLVIGLAFIGLILSLLKSYRLFFRPCLFLILCLGLGSGVIIHAGLKEHWGRPRPKQVIEFGGNQPFRSYYQPHFSHQTEPSKSFACGHASTGFYFFALALLGSFYHSAWLYWLGWGSAWIFGGLLSFTRIAQGAHFFSDVAASALIMWLTSWVLAYFVFYRKGWNHERINS